MAEQKYALRRQPGALSCTSVCTYSWRITRCWHSGNEIFALYTVEKPMRAAVW